MSSAQLGEVEAAGGPQLDRLVRRGQQLVGLVLTEMSAADPDQKRGETFSAELLQRPRIGEALQHSQRGLGVVARADHVSPARAQKLDQRIETLHRLGAAPPERGAVPDRPLERLPRAQVVDRPQTLWVQQRQAGQHPAVEPVGLGVLVVVVPQVRRLLGGH